MAHGRLRSRAPWAMPRARRNESGDEMRRRFAGGNSIYRWTTGVSFLAEWHDRQGHGGMPAKNM